MDAKIEQSIRLALEQAKGNEGIDGVTRVVGIDASTGLAILSELDRLREFATNARLAWECNVRGSVGPKLKQALDKLDARATGGEGI